MNIRIMTNREMFKNELTNEYMDNYALIQRMKSFKSKSIHPVHRALENYEAEQIVKQGQEYLDNISKQLDRVFA